MSAVVVVLLVALVPLTYLAVMETLNRDWRAVPERVYRRIRKEMER